MRVSTWISLLVLGALLSGCRNAPSNPNEAMPPVPAAATEFSGDAAFEHLRALAALGPRVAGTPEAAQTRAYLRERAREARPQRRGAALRRAAGTRRRAAGAGESGGGDPRRFSAALRAHRALRHAPLRQLPLRGRERRRIRARPAARARARDPGAPAALHDLDRLSRPRGPARRRRRRRAAARRQQRAGAGAAGRTQRGVRSPGGVVPAGRRCRPADRAGSALAPPVPRGVLAGRSAARALGRVPPGRPLRVAGGEPAVVRLRRHPRRRPDHRPELRRRRASRSLREQRGRHAGALLAEEPRDRGHGDARGARSDRRAARQDRPLREEDRRAGGAAPGARCERGAGGDRARGHGPGETPTAVTAPAETPAPPTSKPSTPPERWEPAPPPPAP